MKNITKISHLDLGKTGHLSQCSQSRLSCTPLELSRLSFLADGTEKVTPKFEVAAVLQQGLSKAPECGFSLWKTFNGLQKQEEKV